MKFQDKSIDELELTVRSYNCLKNANIRTLKELVVHSEAELLKGKAFGRKSLNEIKEVLASVGLRLGMREEDDEDGSVPVRQPNAPTPPDSGAAVTPEEESFAPKGER